MKKNVLFKKYHTKNVIIMGPEQEVVVCSKSNRLKKDDSLYIINIFKKNSTINILLPGIEDLKKTGYMYYVEHFLKDNRLYVVFNYFAQCKVKHYIESKELSFTERLRAANSFFINALELRMIPAIMQYKLLNPDNININDYGIVYFSHILDFREKCGDIDEQDIVERIGCTLVQIFKGHADIPQTFDEYLKSIGNKEFEGVESVYVAFKPFLKEFIGDGDVSYSKTIQPLPDITIQPKDENVQSRNVFKSILITLMVLCLSTAFYFGFMFFGSLLKSITTPVDVPVITPTSLPDTAKATENSYTEDNLAEPTTSKPSQVSLNTPATEVVPESTPVVVLSPTPAPEGSETTVSTPVPTSAPEHTSTPEPGSTSTPIPSPEVTPVSSESPLPTPTAQPEYILYEVQKGEWLKEICRKYYGNPGYYKQVSVYNNIQNPSEINAGQVIKLPNINILEDPVDSSSGQE